MPGARSILLPLALFCPLMQAFPSQRIRRNSVHLFSSRFNWSAKFCISAQVPESKSDPFDFVSLLFLVSPTRLPAGLGPPICDRLFRFVNSFPFDSPRGRPCALYSRPFFSPAGARALVFVGLARGGRLRFSYDALLLRWITFRLCDEL